MKIQDLQDEDEIWDLISHYLAVFCSNIAYICSPEVIILGGIQIIYYLNYQLNKIIIF